MSVDSAHDRSGLKAELRGGGSPIPICQRNTLRRSVHEVHQHTPNQRLVVGVGRQRCNPTRPIELGQLAAIVL
jgi:hypothetical protein